MRPVVVTTINPFSKIKQQLRCFQAWKNLGFDVRTINFQDEIPALLAAGISGDVILSASPNETGLPIFNKPVPRIRALLKRLEVIFPDQPVLLTNADIYPAIRSAEYVDQLLSKSPALALTRQEEPIVENFNLADNAPYRGGLDCFLMSPQALIQTNAFLSRWPVAERMCFGIPGWDYLLGAVLIQDEIGGMILDSGVLLHEQHKTTYSGVEEFAHYLPAMRELGVITSHDTTAAVGEFAAKIHEDCIENIAISTALKALFFCHVRPEQPSSSEAMRVAGVLCDLAPWARWNYNFANLAVLAERQLQSSQPQLETSVNFFTTGTNLQQQFSEFLMAILFHMETAHDQDIVYSTSYPASSLHSRAIEYIQSKTEDQPLLQRFEIVKIFAEELITYRIFNQQILEFLMLSCRNDIERALLLEISKFTRTLRYAA